ncbi:unnamed protein product [Schistosoma curassoni]|uniref:TACC_C domain-containing protein n=1 Tax=Schistosoma curassoni TaxID=6186 RepID=A0A183JWA5_9TREM|nr:unnamed protein product [Schistosoma curassoni]
MSRTSESHELNSCSATSKEGYFSDTLQDAPTMNDFVQSEEISHSLTIDDTVENSKCLLNNVYFFLSNTQFATSIDEYVLHEKNEVTKANNVFPRDDYEFLGLLEQQITNKKTRITSSNLNNSIMLNFDPLMNVSENNASPQLCKSIDQLSEQLITTTPESSNNNSTINASYYNRTGHLISPIGNEELINIATASPSVITTTTSSSIPTTESTVASLSPYVNIDKFNSPCDDVIQCITTTVPVKTTCSTVVELPSSSSILTNKSSTTGVAITAIANTTTFYSPWRHRSVLNQALGGGDGDDDDGGGNSSPEWSSFSIPNDNKLHEISIIQQGQLEYNHDNSDNNLCEDFSNHNNKEEYESTTRKIKENSIHKTTNHSELDLLVNMLDRVEMKDDTMQESDKSTIVTQIVQDCNLAMNECQFRVAQWSSVNNNLSDSSFPPTRLKRRTFAFHKTPEIQSSKSVTPSLTFNIRKSENLLNNKKLVDTPKTSNLTSTPFLFNKSICIPEEFQQMNVLDVLPYNTPDQCIVNHNTDMNTTPYTKDTGGISGFLSKAARSVYSRLISSGSSQLALKDTSLVNKPQSIIDSSFIESCSVGNKVESIKKEFSIEQEKHQQQSCLNITSSFVQSEQISQQLLDDEEAWKTVSSVHDLNGSMEISSKMEITGSCTDGDGAMLLGNKENAECLQVHKIIHEDIDDVSMKSENNSSTSNISRSPLKELLNNIKDVNTTDNNITTNDFDHNNQSCHEHNGTTSTTTTTTTTTTTVPSISSSSPTKSVLSISINDNNSVIENLENIEITKQNLRDEITKLKNEADLWKSVLKDYQSTYIKAETIISECQLVETTKLIHLIEERNETMDQAKRMLAVYKDMMHRVERAQNVLQFAKKKQESLKMNFDKIHSSMLTIQEKQHHFINSYEQQLNNALINQDKQNDLYQRKLNKLTYERRQTDMRILSLTEEVKQKGSCLVSTIGNCMVASDQRLVHTPFVPVGYWNPCPPLVLDPVKAPDILFSSSHFRKQHPPPRESSE